MSTGAIMTARDMLHRLSRRFAAAGMATPDLDARIMVLEISGLSHAALIAAPETALTPEGLAALEVMAARRLAGAPVSRILGRREFYGREFHLSPATLDPRPDTETLIDHVLDWAQAAGRRQELLRLLDLGTGSGAILVTLLAELPHAQGVGSDISPAALEQAHGNAERHGVAKRAGWRLADWCRDLDRERFDVIVSNPPYIAAGELAGLALEVRLGDPLAALDGGADGLAAYRAIARDAAGLLAMNGFAALEVGVQQHVAVCEIFGAAGFRLHPLTGGSARDMAGRVRVVSFSGPA